MIYYFELFSVNTPRLAQKQQIVADTPEEAVQRLRATYEDDLQVVYDEDFVTHYEAAS